MHTYWAALEVVRCFPIDFIITWNVQPLPQPPCGVELKTKSRAGQMKAEVAVCTEKSLQGLVFARHVLGLN